MMIVRRLARLTLLLVGSLMLALVSLSANAQSGGAALIVGDEGRYATIESALQAARDGDVIEVRGGSYSAPLVIDKRVSLIGVNHPVIDGSGQGSLVLITASDVVFQGFTLMNTGRSLAHEDTGIVIQADNVTVAENTLENVLFGIYFADASYGIARDNVVRCIPLDPGMRGDGFRTWYSDGVTLSGNSAFQCRDMLFWYSNDLLIERNTFSDSRYALHFMYNRNATVQFNTFEHSSVGTYFMYSDWLTFHQNTISYNRGVSAYGIALKDADHVTITDNLVIGNRIGVYIDNSPTRRDHMNHFSGNFIAYNDIGITAQPSVTHNVFQSNSFVENVEQAAVSGRGTLLGITWSENGAGNYWSDYVGYDADGDGVGDMPYRAEKLFETLADSYPMLRLFVFSPASQALDFAAAAFPSLRPDPKVIDEAPSMVAVVPTSALGAPQGQSLPFLAVSLALLTVGAGVCLFALRSGSVRQKYSRRRAEHVRAGA